MRIAEWFDKTGPLFNATNAPAVLYGMAVLTLTLFCQPLHQRAFRTGGMPREALKYVIHELLPADGDMDAPIMVTLERVFGAQTLADVVAIGYDVVATA